LHPTGLKRPPTPKHVAELVAAVRCWLAEERIERTIVWIEEQPLPLTLNFIEDD
jgi:hypothetical protein